MSDSKPCPETILQGTLYIPEKKPGVDMLLRATSTPAIDKIVLLDKKILISGQLLLVIEYAARVPDGSQPLCMATYSLPFQSCLTHCRARSGMNAQLQALVKMQAIQPVDTRTLSYLLLLHITLCRLTKGGETCPCHTLSSCLTLCPPVKAPPVHHNPCPEYPEETPIDCACQPPPQHVHPQTCCSQQPACNLYGCSMEEMPPF